MRAKILQQIGILDSSKVAFTFLDIYVTNDWKRNITVDREGVSKVDLGSYID
jgi:hypothetical protein